MRGEDINLSGFKLVQPSSIRKKRNPIKMYDIEVEEDNSFFIFNNGEMLLSHNCDGSHIASLIINFFHKWFPYIIREGRLHMLLTPMVSGNYEGKKKYFWTLDEFNKFSKEKKLSGVNYLKGLGSLNIEDWEWVMGNKVIFTIQEDKSSDKYLDIAFGDSSDKRKKWLEDK